MGRLFNCLIENIRRGNFEISIKDVVKETGLNGIKVIIQIEQLKETLRPIPVTFFQVIPEGSKIIIKINREINNVFLSYLSLYDTIEMFQQ